MKPEERRQSQREPVKVPVSYGAVDAFFTEFASNINEGGMFIETDNPSDIDDLVQLQFTFPGVEGSIQIGGRVAWINDGKEESPAGMGIEFLDLTPETRDKINDSVRKLRL